jgi:hypothetical protein
MGINSQEVAYGFGQMGSAYLADGAEYTPPTGTAVVAITVLDDATTFEELVPDTSGYTDGTTGAAGTGSAAYIGTTAVVGANGTNADAIGTGTTWKAGLTLVGRWTKVELGAGSVIMYLGTA